MSNPLSYRPMIDRNLLRLFCLVGMLWGHVLGNNGVVASETPPATPLKEEKFDIYQGAIPIRVFSFEREEDRDYDKQPDDWVRRRGEAFRQFVTAEIDYQQAAAGKRSLRIDANGSGAVYYSPPLPIDARHSYVMQASVLTRGLVNDAAVVSFSFLNHRKERIERIVTPPVSGTHQSWVPLKLPVVVPSDDVRFVVIGCHLIHSRDVDMRGSAWFDQLSISKLPRLRLASNFETHFRKSQSEISIQAEASGLDARNLNEPFRYELRLQVEDVHGHVLDRTSYSLDSELQAEESVSGQNENRRDVPINWHLPVYRPGYYRVRASLLRNDLNVISKTTSFTVMNLQEEVPLQGEFGWNLTGARHRVSQRDLLAISRQAGIHWMKTPVWQEADSLNSSEAGQFLTSLRNQSIMPIGMLVQPPASIRQKFAENWTGISEVFTSSPAIWREEVNRVMALYSPTVSRWQLGDDRDTSFVGMPEFDRTLENIRSELQRIGQIRQLGVLWNTTAPVPSHQALSRNFLTIIFDETQTLESVTRSVREIQQAGYQAWVVVKAARPGSHDNPNHSAQKLVQRLVEAKCTGCDLVFAYDIFDPESGLLEPDGSPTELFLPWRTVSVTLNNSRYAGSIQLPGRSQNSVFLRENDAVIVLQNREELEEEIYLGDQVTLHNVWGDQFPLQNDPVTGRQKIPVSSAPVILTGCSKNLMAWRMGIRFEKGRVASSLAEQEDTLMVENTFPWEVQGTLQMRPERGWEISPAQVKLHLQAAETAEFPIGIKIPARTNLGEQLIAIEFNLSGAGVSYPFIAYCEYQVGLGDVEMDVRLIPDGKGGVIVEQQITNKTNPPEVLDLRCHLYTRGRRRQTRQLDTLMSGQKQKVSYLIPDFQDLPAQDLWLRAEQKNGQRTLNDLLDETQVQKKLRQSTLVE